MSSARYHSGLFFVLPPIAFLRIPSFWWPGSVLLHVRPLCTVLTKYPWDKQYPSGYIRTQARGVGIAGGGSDAYMYIVNWRCKFLTRLVAARSSTVSVAFVVGNVPTDWRSSVVAVSRFESAWAWFCWICFWAAAFACPVAAQMWA